MASQIVRRVAKSNLTREERHELESLEHRIDRALRYHLEAAKALREIRDRRLYRNEFDNFENYCAARWHIARAHANRLCDWAEISENVSPIGDKVPLRESHARPLTRLTPQQQRKAWRQLLEIPRHTERVVEQVCSEVRCAPVNGNGRRDAQVVEARLETPLPWYGGKGTLAADILRVLPPHETYIEPFFGGGAVLFAKPPAKNELVNDIHGDVVDFFRVLRDTTSAKRLQEQLRLTPYSREEHRRCKECLETNDAVERARRFFTRVRQSFACEDGGAWARNFDAKRTRVSEWCETVDRLHEIADRLRRVQIESRDFRELLPECDLDGTVIYADPPYLAETRGRSAYQHEMSEADHAELLGILNRLRRARVVLSGYDSPLYRARLRSWTRFEFQRTVSTARPRQQKVRRTEVVWVSPK